MRNLLILLLFLIVSLPVGAQTQQTVALLNKGVKLCRKSLPVTMGAIVVDGISLADDVLAVHCSVQDDTLSVETVCRTVSSPLERQPFVTSLLAGGNISDSILVASKSHVRVTFDGVGSHLRRELFVPSDVVARDYAASCARDSVHRVVELMCKALPRTLGNGLVLTSISADASCVIYRVRTDNPNLSIPMLQLVKNTCHDMEDSILEGFVQATDDSTVRFRTHLLMAGLDVKYVYWSNSSTDQVEFVVTSDEIRNGLK